MSVAIFCYVALVIGRFCSFVLRALAALALRRQLYSWRRWSSSGTRVEDTFLARRQLSYVSWRAFLAALSRAKNQPPASRRVRHPHFCSATLFQHPRGALRTMVPGGGGFAEGQKPVTQLADHDFCLCRPSCVTGRTARPMRRIVAQRCAVCIPLRNSSAARAPDRT